MEEVGIRFKWWEEIIKHVDYIQNNSHKKLYVRICVLKANKSKDLLWLVAKLKKSMVSTRLELKVSTFKLDKLLSNMENIKRGKSRYSPTCPSLK